MMNGPNKSVLKSERVSGVMAGRRGLVMGVANDKSIAWGMAASLHAHGAELAFTYQNEAMEKRVRPLAGLVDADMVLPCDVCDDASMDKVFEALEGKWGEMDFLVHAIAYSDKDELKGRYLDTSRDNFLRTMDVSCYSFTTLAKRAASMMGEGGSMVTLSFSGAERVMPNYNVMGVAKAALESSVRYLASDLGPRGVRVNAISAGPMRTLAGSAISGARHVFRWNQHHAPLKRTVTLDELGGTALYLLSDLGGGVTGEVLHVDAGYHIVGLPSAESMAATDE